MVKFNMSLFYSLNQNIACNDWTLGKILVSRMSKTKTKDPQTRHFSIQPIGVSELCTVEKKIHHGSMLSRKPVHK